MTSPLVVFTTDFGLSDPYAGVIKGVALSINPDLRLIDLTHQISPQKFLRRRVIRPTLTNRLIVGRDTRRLASHFNLELMMDR